MGATSSFQPQQCCSSSSQQSTQTPSMENHSNFPICKKEKKEERKIKKRKVPRYCPVVKSALQPISTSKENNESPQPKHPGSYHAAPNANKAPVHRKARHSAAIGHLASTLQQAKPHFQQSTPLGIKPVLSAVVSWPLCFISMPKNESLFMVMR